MRLYAGVDPLTGRRLDLAATASTEAEARKALTRFRAQADDQRNARTRGSLRTALGEWLAVQELEATVAGYQSYIRRYIEPALGAEPVSKMTARTLERFYAELRRCRLRCNGRPFVEHRIEGQHECEAVTHRRPPGRRPTGGYPTHDCAAADCTVTACPPHTCKPLSNATIVKIHFILSGTLAAAVRWGWIPSNPAVVATKPRQPTPQPDPPSPADAARIGAAAWEQDPAWGTLVWLVMVTGLRRAELLALRWSDVDLDAGYLAVRRNCVRVGGRTIEKDTKGPDRYRAGNRAPVTARSDLWTEESVHRSGRQDLAARTEHRC